MPERVLAALTKTTSNHIDRRGTLCTPRFVCTRRYLFDASTLTPTKFDPASRDEAGLRVTRRAILEEKKKGICGLQC